MATKPNTIAIPDDDQHIWLEYICIKTDRKTFVSKIYIVSFEPRTVEECPTKAINEYISPQSTAPCPELALRPVALFRDPFRQGKHKLVLCELDYFSDEILVCETRPKCKQLLERVADKEPWFGFEQTYFFVDQNDYPFDWHLAENNPKLGEHTGWHRQLAETHLKACLYAGLEMFGMNREYSPSQWEYQLGPLSGIAAPDQLVVSRYILVKLAEMNGLKVTLFNHKWMLGTDARSALHVNFSTKVMREVGGLQHIESAIENISKYRPEDVLKFYDMEQLGSDVDYKWRLNGIPFMPKWDNFVYKVGEKYDTTIRIPAQVAEDGRGYFEERRPSGEADPYEACRVLTATAILEKYEL